MSPKNHPKIPGAGISRRIWDSKYRYRRGGEIRDETLEDSWKRIARALAEAEDDDRARWEAAFYGALDGFSFLPGGRILANAGTGHSATLFNCFVMGSIEDSMDGIFDALKEGAITLQQGGGVGYDFSTLRPRGSPARSTGTIASGPVSFMRVWDSMCATLLSTGSRRGAMMATLRCDHPDIEDYVAAKRIETDLRHFNLSVQITDAFLESVRLDEDWPLVFPASRLDGVSGDTVPRIWSGETAPVTCVVLRRIRARELWDSILRAAYDVSEPGVLFIDRINSRNNLGYRETITATNPCGEIPLPPYGACNLGSINLTRFVRKPFSAEADLDIDSLEATSAIATRMLDDVIDISRFPLDEQEKQARGSRRMGLGITGLADALIMMGLHYDDEKARELAARAMRAICTSAYRTSIDLAKERGPFPFFRTGDFLNSEFARLLPADIRRGIAEHGLRNSHITAIAPSGTISLLANNVSSGLEPVFDFEHSRRILEPGGRYRVCRLTDYALDLWRRMKGTQPLPSCFVNARSLPPRAHLDMQAALQPYVDSAISKTINVPEDYSFAEFRSLYDLAYDKGLKGCTTFRPNAVTGAVLETEGPPDGSDAQTLRGTHCCGMEREGE